MADEKLPFERTQTLVFDNADSMSLEMQTIEKQMVEMNRSIARKEHELQILGGQRQQLVGKYSEIAGGFWLKSRESCADWIDLVQSYGYDIHIQRAKLEEGMDVKAVQLVAKSPDEDPLFALRQLGFRRNPPRRGA